MFRISFTAVDWA